MCAKIVFCVCGNGQVEKDVISNSEQITMTGATFALLTLTTLILEIEINGHILTWFRSNELFHIQVKHQRVLNQTLWELNTRI
jgi:hypothetical protein